MVKFALFVSVGLSLFEVCFGLFLHIQPVYVGLTPPLLAHLIMHVLVVYQKKKISNVYSRNECK